VVIHYISAVDPALLYRIHVITTGIVKNTAEVSDLKDKYIRVVFCHVW